MSRHGVVLPIPDSGPLRDTIDALVAAWPDPPRWPLRARWLSELERALVPWFPLASSRDRNLTARSLAPFPLAERDWL